MIPLVVYIFVTIQLIVVSYVDLKIKKISNIWSLLNIGLYFLLLFIFPNEYHFSLNTFIFPTIFIVVGFALFMMNIMGGGDSKYLGTLYLLIPVSTQQIVFVHLLYATILVGSTLLLYNFLKNLDKTINHLKIGNIRGVQSVFGKKFSYAPVIFISWMWFGWQNYKKFFF